MGNQYISECQIITNNVAVTGTFTASCYLGTVVRSVAGKSGNVNLNYTDIAGAPQAGTTVQGLGVTGSPGTSTTSYARGDHVHPACIQISPQTTDFGLGLATTEYVKNQAHLIDATILPSNPSGGKSGSDKYTGPGQYLFALGQHQHPSDTTKLNVSGGSLTGNVSGTGAFFNYISASQFAGDGSLLTNLVSQDVTKLPLAGGTLTGGLTGTTASFNSLSGDGSLLYNVFGTDTSKIPIAGGTFTGSITGTTACFTDLCATRLFGDGSGLTNLLKPNEQLKFDSINISDSPSNGQQIGYRTGTPQNESLNIGYQACSTGICSTVIGNSAIGGIGASVLGLAACAGTCSVAVGFCGRASNSAGSTVVGACASVSNTTNSSEAVAIGFSSFASSNATAIGSKADARTCGVAVGQGANAGIGGGTAIGTQTLATNTGTAVGCCAHAIDQGASVGAISCGSDKGAAVGFSAIACNGGVAVGYTAYSPISGVAIGCRANAGETGNVAIGTGAKATSLDVAIGNFASANTNATALGDQANASNDSIAIGKNSTASSNSIAIGNNTTTLNNQIVIGSTNSLAADKANLTIIGNNINSSGECSVNIGYNITSTDSATVIGIKSTASPCSVVIGDDSCSIMQKTIDSGPSIVVGNKIIAKEASVAVGYNNLVQDESIGVGSHIIACSRSFAGGDCACASGNSIGIGYCTDAEVCSLSLGNFSYACDRSTAAGYGAIAAIGSTSIGCGAWSRCFSTVIGIHSGAVTYGSIGIGPDAKIRGFCIKDICSALDFSNFPHAYALSKTTALSPLICDVGLGYATCPQLYIPGANVSGCGIPPNTVICTVTPDPNIKGKVRLTLSNVVQPPACCNTSNSNLLKITHPYVCFQDAEMSCGCNILCISNTAPEDEKGVYRRLFNSNADLSNADTYGSSSEEKITGFYGGHIHCGRLPGATDVISRNPSNFPSYTNVRCALYDGWGSAILIEENTPGIGSLRRVNLSTGLRTKFSSCTQIACCVTPENLNSNNWDETSKRMLLDPRYSFASDGRYLYLADACTHTLGFIDLTNAPSTKTVRDVRSNSYCSLPIIGTCLNAIQAFVDVPVTTGCFNWFNDGKSYLNPNTTIYSTSGLYNKNSILAFQPYLKPTTLPTVYEQWTQRNDGVFVFNPARNYSIQPLASAIFIPAYASLETFSAVTTALSAYYSFVKSQAYFAFPLMNGSGMANETGTPYVFVNPLSTWDFISTRNPSGPGAGAFLQSDAVHVTLAERFMLSTVRFNEPRFLQYVYDETTKERSLYVINTSRKATINGKTYEVDGNFGPQFGYVIFKIKLGNALDIFGSSTYKVPVSGHPYALSVTPIASLNKVVSGISTSNELLYNKTITHITGMIVDPKGNIFVSARAEDTRVNGFSATRFYDANNNADGQFLSDFVIKIPSSEKMWHTSHTFSSSCSAYAINNAGRYPNFRYPKHMAIDKYDNLLIVDAMVSEPDIKNPYAELNSIVGFRYPQSFYTRIRRITPQGYVSTLQTVGGTPQNGKSDFDFKFGTGYTVPTTTYFNTLCSLYWSDATSNVSKLSASYTAGYGIAYNPINENIYVSCVTNNTIVLLTPLSTPTQFSSLSGLYLQTRFAGASTQQIPITFDGADDKDKISVTTASRLQISLNQPRGLCLDFKGSSVPMAVTSTTWNLGGTTPYLYVADSGSHSIRRINADPSGDGASILIAGGSKAVGTPTQATGNDNKVYNFYPGTQVNVSNVFYYKNYESGYTNSTINSQVGKNALFKKPTALALSNSGQYLYVSDEENFAIRRITLWIRSGTNIIPLIKGNESFAIVQTVAGASEAVVEAGQGSNYVDGAGDIARFRSPSQIVVDENPDTGETYLYVADSQTAGADNSTIRKIVIPNNWNGLSSQTTVSTFVGPVDGAYYPSRFGQPGVRSGFYDPRGLVKDKNGNFYVAESYNSTIRKISPQGLVIDYAGMPTKTGLTSLVEYKDRNVQPIVDSGYIQPSTWSATPTEAELKPTYEKRNDEKILNPDTSSFPTMVKNSNKDWRSILSGRFSGIPFSTAYSMQLSAIFNNGSSLEPSSSRYGVTTSSLSGFHSNISYMTYRSLDQSTAADQIFILTASPILSSTNTTQFVNNNPNLANSAYGTSSEFWQLGSKPSNHLALSGLWSMATNGFGRFKGCLKSIDANPATIRDAIMTQSGLINNSLLVDSTLGYYASFSNPVALLPHYKLTNYPDTLNTEGSVFPFSNSLTIIDSSADGSRSVIRKKTVNDKTVADHNTNGNRFFPVQTVFGNIYNSQSFEGNTSGITAILDGLAYTNPDGTPKYPYQDFAISNTGKTYNNVYLSNTYHGVIYRYNILTKSVSSIAGIAGLPGEDSVPKNIDPVFMLPPSVGTGNLYHGNGIPSQSYITFKNPRGLVISNDNSQLWVADTGNHLIKRIDTPESAPVVTTIAGRVSSAVFYTAPYTSPVGLPLGAVSATRFIGVSGREMGNALSGTFEFPTKLHLSTFSTNAGNISAHPLGTYLNRLSGGNYILTKDPDLRFRLLTPGNILYISDREIIRKLYLNSVTSNSTLSCVGNLSAASLPPANFNGGGNIAGQFFNPGSPYNNSQLLPCYPESDYDNRINPITDVSGDSTGRIYYTRKFADKEVLFMVDAQETFATYMLQSTGIGFEGANAQFKAIHSDGVGSKIFIAGTQKQIETKDNYQIVWEFLTADRSYTNLFDVARDQGQKLPKGVEKYTQLTYDLALDRAIAGDKYLQMINYDFNKSNSVRDTLYFSTYKLTDGFDLKVGMSVELYAITWSGQTPTEITGNLLPPFTYVTAILDENRVLVSKPLSATSSLRQASTVIPTDYTSTGSKRLTARFQRIDYRVMIPITLTNNSNNITLPSTGLSAVDTSLLKVGDYLIDIVEPFSQVVNGVLTESYTSTANRYFPYFEENDKTEGMGKLHPRTIVEIPTGAGSNFRLSQRASFSSSVLNGPNINNNQITVMGLFYPGPGIAIGRNSSTTLNSSLAIGSPSQPLALNAPVPNQAIPAPARYVRVTVNGLDYMMPLYNIPDGL